ncbi:hypothetical protein llap_531 [Limosa lapponica baueri]|uniref:Secreted protein n=1 Tax=Limosa lapponica baueri TaxID=1758121 RepID=A0A2I0UT68_LIMLA|nr:hypothetical protein llap_531 [Limosa lapponica baueri]
MTAATLILTFAISRLCYCNQAPAASPDGFFFQLFQLCCFMASLFNPPIIRGPINSSLRCFTKPQQHQEGYLRADTASALRHT